MYGGKYDSELIWEKILKPKQYFCLEVANYIVSWDYSAHIHRKENENYLYNYLLSLLVISVLRHVTELMWWLDA